VAGVRFSFLGAAELCRPSDIPTQAVSDDADLREVLAAISPEKKGFLHASRIDALTVLPTDAIPFGPTWAQLVGALLADDEETAARNIADRFGVPIAETPDAHPIDFYEFAQLDAVARTGAFTPGVIVSFFVTPEQVYALHVARNRPLSEALGAVAAVREYLEAHPDATLRNPLKGIELDPDEPCGPRTDLVSFSTSAYALQPRRSWLMPFPYFSQPLAMRKSGSAPRKPDPCSNCLACVRCCPAGIHPALLHHHVCADDEGAYGRLGLDQFTECGLCTAACPSRLPLYASIEKAKRAAEEEQETTEEGAAS